MIGKAHSGILNITAQVPKVVINYPLKKHCDLNESFTGKSFGLCLIYVCVPNDMSSCLKIKYVIEKKPCMLYETILYNSDTM